MKFGNWYCEYKNHVRIHDYVSIMINNFPLLVIREYTFGLHEEKIVEVLCVVIMGFSFTIN